MLLDTRDQTLPMEQDFIEEDEIIECEFCADVDCHSCVDNLCEIVWHPRRRF